MDQARRKVALVTGASRGVGARVAQLLGAAGCVVVVNYRSKQRRAEELADEVENSAARRCVPAPT